MSRKPIDVVLSLSHKDSFSLYRNDCITTNALTVYVYQAAFDRQIRACSPSQIVLASPYFLHLAQFSKIFVLESRKPAFLAQCKAAIKEADSLLYN
jgi:hypothetical protein